MKIILILLSIYTIFFVGYLACYFFMKRKHERELDVEYERGHREGYQDGLEYTLEDEDSYRDHIHTEVSALKG